jgi:hypothetical protein
VRLIVAFWQTFALFMTCCNIGISSDVCYLQVIFKNKQSKIEPEWIIAKGECPKPDKNNLLCSYFTRVLFLPQKCSYPEFLICERLPPSIKTTLFSLVTLPIGVSFPPTDLTELTACLILSRLTVITNS